MCETAIQVHGGIGNTWECLAHVYLRRALLSIDVLGGVGANLARVLDHHGHRRRPMDFGDSPDEAEFRARLRDWLRDNNPGLPASSTDDDYWAGQAAWHQSLYDAGFFGLSWPTDIGGQDAAERLRRDPRRGARRRRRAAAPEPRLPRAGHPRARQRRHPAAASCPGIINGRDRWCQGFSEPDAGSDLASLRTRADRDGDEYVITGHKVWTSYSDVADWCLLLARTDPDVPKHKGLSAFAVPMRPARHRAAAAADDQRHHQRVRRGALRRRPRAGRQHDRRARARAGALAMTVVSHEREPGELGYVARYRKTGEGARPTGCAPIPTRYGAEQVRDLGWAIVEAEMLRLHVCRRLSDRLDGIAHGPEGSVDKLLMTAVEQAVGHAALAVGGAGHGGGDDTWLKVYLYSRAQSVMGGTSQIQRNLVATRILGLPDIMTTPTTSPT